jgi:chemotaxis protein methyltransferase CheR
MTGGLPLDLKYFKDLVQERAGLTFDNTREEILRQKISEVMGQRGYRSRAQLFSALLNNDAVFLDFVNHLTINETYFFREPQYLQLLTSHLVPEILTGKKKGEKIKIISAGCSTGEEPYSIAISLLEKFGEETANLFSIAGFDLNSTALEKAEAGLYGNLSFRGNDEQVRSRYFEASRFGLFSLKPLVRDLVEFTRFNLLSEDYPKLLRMADVVFYRNVSIYFDSPTQRKILTGLASILNDGGCVVFSASETFSHQDIGGLSLIESQGLFYFQKIRCAKDQPAGVNPPSSSGDSTGRWRLPGMARERSGQKTAPAKGGALPVFPTGKSGKGGVGLGESPEELVGPEELFQEALTCFRRKDHVRASQLAESLQACESHRAKAYLLRGCVLLVEGKLQAAEELFGKALQLDGLDLEAHLLLGLAAKNSGETAKAIKCFHNALYVQNSCWMAHYFLAEIFLAAGNFPKALKYYDSLLKILEKTSDEKPRLTFFPISFKREDLLHLCRRKIASISENSHGL